MASPSKARALFGAALMALAASACLAPANPVPIRAKAANDFGCPANSITVDSKSEDLASAEGCGQRATYARWCTLSPGGHADARSSPCTWERQSAR